MVKELSILKSILEECPEEYLNDVGAKLFGAYRRSWGTLGYAGKPKKGEEIYAHISKDRVRKSEVDSWITSYDLLCFVAERFVDKIKAANTQVDVDAIWRELRTELAEEQLYERVRELGYHKDSDDIIKILLAYGGPHDMVCDESSVIEFIMPKVIEVCERGGRKGISFTKFVVNDYIENAKPKIKWHDNRYGLNNIACVYMMFEYYDYIEDGAKDKRKGARWDTYSPYNDYIERRPVLKKVYKDYKNMKDLPGAYAVMSFISDYMNQFCENGLDFDKNAFQAYVEDRRRLWKSSKENVIYDEDNANKSSIEMMEEAFSRLTEFDLLYDVYCKVVQPYEWYMNASRAREYNRFRRFNETELSGNVEPWVVSFSHMYDVLDTLVQMYNHKPNRNFDECLDALKSYYYLTDNGYNYFVGLVSEPDSDAEYEYLRQLIKKSSKFLAEHGRK